MNDINWNALYGFWLVAEHGSFSAAGRVLSRGTIQALFKRVRQLETSENLNLRLFRSRGVKGVELTEAGLRLYRHLDPAFRSFHAIAAELRGEDQGPLVFAMTGYSAYNYGREVIQRFRKQFPKVLLTIRVRPASEVIGLLESGYADFGICAPVPGMTNLAIGARVPLPIEIIAPKNHPFSRKPFGWEDVVNEPLAIPARDALFRLELERLLYRRNLISKLQVIADVNEGELAVEAVRGGAGLALIGVGPRLAQHLRGLCRILPPPGLPKFETAILHRSDRYLPRYMRAFEQVAGEVLNGLPVRGLRASKPSATV